MSATVNFHQTVHGYSKGHRLLSTSCPLSDHDQWLMQKSSDLAGLGQLSGFESYITGYPLSDSSQYVIAKTWANEEESRPGSVWTHSILIPFGILPNVNAYTSINALFKKPSSLILNTYGESLTFKLPCAPDSLTLNPETKYWLWQTIRDLYSSNEPMAFQARADIDIHQVVYALWAQQWPGLRRSFTFCTGSKAPRYFEGKLMDLQVLPIHSQEIRSSLYEASTDVHLNDDWSNALLNDLESPSPKFRNSLNTYAADISGHKELLPSLVSVICILNKKSLDFADFIKTIDILANSILSREDSSRLKKALFSPRTTRENVLLIKALIESDTNAFASDFSSFFKQVVGDIAEEHPGACALFLERIETTNEKLYEASIGKLLSLTGDRTLSTLAQRDTRIGLTLIEARPDLLLSIIKEVADDTVTNLLDRSTPWWKDNSTLSESIALALLRNSQYELVLRFVGLKSLGFTNAVLKNSHSIIDMNIGEHLLDEIYFFSPDLVVGELASRPRELLPLCRGILRKCNIQEISQHEMFSPSNWKEAWNDADYDKQFEAYIRLIALACGLDNIKRDFGSLFSANLAFVYNHLGNRNNIYDHVQWSQLERSLVIYGNYKIPEWDRCKKLRLAILELPITAGISPKTIIELVSNTPILGEIKRTYHEERKPKSASKILDPIWSPVFGKNKGAFDFILWP